MRHVALAAALAVLTLWTGPAALAHHGWEEFQTSRPLYLSGTVAQVRWGNPHPEVRVRLAAPVTLPGSLATRPIPRELEEIGGRDVLRRTTAHPGPATEVTLILAPLERLSAWGMPDRVRPGERIEAVGYPHREEETEFRPELLVRQDGRAIRQRSVPLPATDGATTGDSTTGGSAPRPDASSGGAVSPVPWIVGGLGVLAVAGGAAYLVRRG
ncbi:DUF6152 family protein [Actinomadura kijaniata]|uniref:DUF6152 family protein n=1 Tax=Actinomadura kijaniata TaxID=46161 RepID=UPI00082EA683|nr:DUF6152 family protein [Actinomadura kijaniata]